MFRVQSLTTTPSTNYEIKRAIEAGEPEGLVIRAYEQTGGYGRQGRMWVSPRGGLYCSWLFRPEISMAGLSTGSLVMALAVRRALVSLTPQYAQQICIKWPNDVVLVECLDVAPAKRSEDPAILRKLSGISLELHQGALCVGMGLNVCPPEEPLCIEGKNTPVYIADLRERTLSESSDSLIDGVFEALIAEVEQAYRAWVARGFSAFIDEYNHHASLTGQFVKMENQAGNPLAQGMVIGVDAQGCLCLEHLDGSITAVSSGEAHVIR